jgi:hypothetical protein
MVYSYPHINTHYSLRSRSTQTVEPTNTLATTYTRENKVLVSPEVELQTAIISAEARSVLSECWIVRNLDVIASFPEATSNGMA